MENKENEVNRSRELPCKQHSVLVRGKTLEEIELLLTDAFEAQKNAHAVVLTTEGYPEICNALSNED